MATYSFVDVTAAIVGPGAAFQMGYGAAVADEGISLVTGGDKNTMVIGSDGEGMHSLHADKSGQVIIRLLKTSPTNALLMAAYDAQTMVSSLHGQNTIVVRNAASGDIATARECAFKKKPDLNFKKDGDIVEWIFDSIKIDTLLGVY